MTNIIREDVVKVDFDIGGSLKELKKLQDELNDLKKKLTGGIDNGAFDDLKEDANESVKPLKKVKEQAEKVTKSVTEIGKKAAKTAFNGLKKLAGISFKALTVGITAVATAIGGVVTKSVQAFADFEQNIGGVQKLFGAGGKSLEDYAKDAGKSTDKVKAEYDKLIKAEKEVIKNANNSHILGFDANKYMETVTGFSASLITDLKGDTVKAADLSNMAIKDMADNANVFGTDLEMVQQVYQGLAKNQFVLLDNLKLGYGGSQEGAKKLVADAAKVDKSIKKNDLSFSNMVKAINVIQRKMGVFGATEKEATGTITGSLNMTKAAWGNLLIAIGSGENLDQCMDNMINSVETFGKNVIPVAEKALGGIGTLVERLAPIIAEKLPPLAEKLLPPLIKAAVELTKGLIKALPNIIKTLATSIVDIFGEQFPIIGKIADFFKNNAGQIANSIKKIIPAVLGLVAAFKLFNGIKSISSIFGGLKGGSGGSKGGAFGIFESLAKTNTKTILKGMANLAIILGGVTILTAAFMAISPYLVKLTDFKSFIEVVGAVTAMGVVGTALAKLGEIAGKIKVATVAKGLANMAIMLGGMGVLTAAFMAVADPISKLCETKSLLKVVTIMGMLSAVGSVMAIFAGIIGMIPIPVVLTGLANIALVIGGMTAIIAAYGALTQIKGFNNFIKTAGEGLATLFNIIGKIGGSLIGGLGEGISNSLPKIGENIAKFATSLKPMFDMFKGIDMSGVGTFFKSLGSFMLQMAGEKILSVFTGGTNFSKLGTSLSTFAEKSQGFFTKVAKFPENGFTNAKKLFNCLAGMSSLPKEGGVVGWFKGDINYETLASGLGHLSSEKVKGFFTAVSDLKQSGFDNAKLLFDCLAGMKSLPKEGGVVGWFSGKVNYSNIAKGLGDLSGEGVKNFFTMVGGLKETAFENTKLLFESLASISKLPKEGGWWDKLTGDETTTLGNIAKDLSNFSDKTKTFFTQVNSLNLNNLNGLWESLKKSKDVTANVSKIVDDNISDVVKKVSQLPKKMGDGIKGGGKSLSSSIVAVWKDAVKASAKPVNKLLNGANWILKQFGSSKRVVSWTPYAKGTDGHKGGNALVNDGRGAELVQMPNGNTFIPRGKNVFIPNAPKGMKVLPANSTAQLMGKSSPTFRYANGVGNIDIWDYIDNSKGLINQVSKKYVNYNGVSGIGKDFGKGMVSTVQGEMTSWAKKLYDEFGVLSLASYNPSKGVEQWRSTVIRALKMEGLYSAENVKRTLFQMQTESGGNPRAINLWDSNAKRGTPSKGLMQVIDPTFKAYARKGFDKNIYDPLSNILASIRYARARYGSLAKAYRGVGYANGGIATKPSIFGEDGAEMAIPLSAKKRNRAIGLWQKTGQMLGLSTHTPEQDSSYYSSNVVEYNTYAPEFNLTISGTNDERALARKVKRWVAEGIEDTFDSYNRKNPKLREA